MAAPANCAPGPPAAGTPPATQPSWRVVDLFCAGGEQWKEMLANAAYGDQHSQVRAYKRLNESVQKATRHRQIVTLACAGVFMAAVFSALQSWWHPAFLSTAAVFLLPKRSWYVGLIPINLASYVFYYYFMGANVLDARIVMQGVMNCCACVYVQLVTDDKEWQFFQSILETERMRLKLEEKMTMVQRLMDSLFDACCLCEEDGRIAGTSPYLEQLLGGRLAGCGLLDLARNAEERTRAKQFLADLVNNRVAGKMHLSLRLPAGCPRVCASLEDEPAGIVDVTVSGIALPSSSDSAAGTGRIYLGFQAETSTAPPAAEEATPLQAGRTLFRSKTGISEFGVASHAGLGVEAERMSCYAERMSCYSAPAILMPSQLLQFLRTAETAVSCTDPDGDCLPPDVLVWVEGRSAPVPVKSVSVGMRVLCHDRLSRGMKFAAIVEAEVHEASPSDWVTLVLEDGTELEVTEDHPVFPHTSGAGAGGVVRAAELQAGRHAVEVLRMVPIGVREVRRRSPGLDEAGAPAERVALSVQQPDRHAIFVAPRPDLVAGVAVASANVGGDEVVDYHRACVKNTFFDAFPSGEEEHLGIPRSGSCPAVMRAAEASLTSRLLPASPSSRGQPGWARTPRATSSKASVISFSTFKSSEQSCAGSAASSGSPGVRLVLGAPALTRHTAGLRGASAMPLPSTVSLSGALELRRDGLLSFGSAAHATGECVPCLMQARFNSGKCAAPCKFGVLCGRCHEFHTEQNLQRIQTKMGRLRRRRDAEGSRSAESSA